MTRLFLMFSLVVISLSSCKKDFEFKEETNEKISSSQINQSALENEYCDFTELQLVGSGIWQCVYQGITVQMTDPMWQIYCDNGNPITVQNGLRLFGSLNIISPQNTAVTVQPQHPSNQFAIEMGTFTGDPTAYQNAVNQFNSAWNSYLSGSSTTYPYLNSYLPAPTSGIVRYTGKLIRITNGSGFALAPDCYSDITPSCMPILPIE